VKVLHPLYFATKVNMARFKVLIILVLQIILVISSPFPEVIDEPVDTASRTDTELNHMDVDGECC
jgi:hypothetical protein